MTRIALLPLAACNSLIQPLAGPSCENRFVLVPAVTVSSYPGICLRSMAALSSTG